MSCKHSVKFKCLPLSICIYNFCLNNKFSKSYNIISGTLKFRHPRPPAWKKSIQRIICFYVDRRNDQSACFFSAWRFIIRLSSGYYYEIMQIAESDLNKHPLASGQKNKLPFVIVRIYIITLAPWLVAAKSRATLISDGADCSADGSMAVMKNRLCGNSF